MGLVVRELDENNNVVSETEMIDCGNGRFINPEYIKSVNLKDEDGAYKTIMDSIDKLEELENKTKEMIMDSIEKLEEYELSELQCNIIDKVVLEVFKDDIDVIKRVHNSPTDFSYSRYYTIEETNFSFNFKILKMKEMNTSDKYDYLINLETEARKVFEDAYNIYKNRIHLLNEN